MSKNEIKDAIGQATGYTFDFDYVDLLYQAITSIEVTYNKVNDDMVFDMVDDIMVYYSNMWIVAQHFHNMPFNIDRNDLEMALFTDIALTLEILSK